MDFNNLENRLKRLYSANDALIDFDVAENINVTHSKEGEGVHSMHVNFGNLTHEELINKVMLLIGLIAGLKDHLKNKINSLGQNSNLVEDAVNNSENLSLVMDINNAEKHGYPLKKFKRTNKSPRIGAVFQALAGSSIMIDEKNDVTAGENASVVICGDVVDDKGEKIIDLEDMLADAVSDIEEFVKKFDYAK